MTAICLVQLVIRESCPCQCSTAFISVHCSLSNLPRAGWAPVPASHISEYHDTMLITTRVLARFKHLRVATIHSERDHLGPSHPCVAFCFSPCRSGCHPRLFPHVHCHVHDTLRQREDPVVRAFHSVSASSDGSESESASSFMLLTWVSGSPSASLSESWSCP